MKELMGINFLGLHMFLKSWNDSLLTVEFGDVWSLFDPLVGVAVPGVSTYMAGYFSHQSIQAIILASFIINVGHLQMTYSVSFMPFAEAWAWALAEIWC